MKLSHRYTRTYATITFFVLSVGFTIIYIAVKRGTTQSAIGKLEKLNHLIAEQIKTGRDYSQHPARRRATILVTKAAPGGTSDEVVVEKNYVWDPELQANVNKMFVTTYHTIAGLNYAITTNTSIIITDNQYFIGILMTFAWIFVFLMAIVVILSEVLSRYLLTPFNHALDEMHEFQLNQNKTIQLKETKTQEFRQLNKLLMEMTTNAKKDYTVLKEFTEHASHELQTPLAAIKAKIEYLMESELNEQQLFQLSSMHDELERLSKINRSLVTLAKLENYEHVDKSLINFSNTVLDVLNAFIDQIKMKGLSLEQRIDKEVYVAIDASLALLLVKNLISNATRHNIPNGIIDVELNATRLIIKNTGDAPTVPTEELFERFKRGNSSVNSIGIGLAIVKKIASLYHHHLSYTYENGWHCIEIVF